VSDRSKSKERVVQAFLDLPEAERLDVVQKLVSYLTEDLGSEDKRLEALRRRADALEAVQLATEHVRAAGELAPDRPITSTRFTEVSKELGLGWSSSAVVRVFGRWRNATTAAAGETVREGPEQRRVRARMRGRDTGREDYVEGLRLWIASDPDGQLGRDYDAFVVAENERRGDKRRLIKSPGLAMSLALPWARLLEIARGETSLAAAQEAERKRILDEVDGRLVGGRSVAVILGLGVAHAGEIADRPDFPTPVAAISGTKAYLLEDLVAYRDGKPFPRRDEGSFQQSLVEMREVAVVLGRTIATARTYVNRELWHLIPRPVGRVGTNHYWWRADFEAWIQRRDPADD
jgi:predicted DNA-binding transcriptional regulator AlpA